MAKTHDTSTPVTREMLYLKDHTRVLVDVTSGEQDDRIKSARTALKERLESAKGECGELADQPLGRFMFRKYHGPADR